MPRHPLLLLVILFSFSQNARPNSASGACNLEPARAAQVQQLTQSYVSAGDPKSALYQSMKDYDRCACEYAISQAVAAFSAPLSPAAQHAAVFLSNLPCQSPAGRDALVNAMKAVNTEPAPPKGSEPIFFYLWALRQYAKILRPADYPLLMTVLERHPQQASMIIRLMGPSIEDTAQEKLLQSKLARLPAKPGASSRNELWFLEDTGLPFEAAKQPISAAATTEETHRALAAAWPKLTFARPSRFVPFFGDSGRSGGLYTPLRDRFAGQMNEDAFRKSSFYLDVTEVEEIEGRQFAKVRLFSVQYGCEPPDRTSPRPLLTAWVPVQGLDGRPNFAVNGVERCTAAALAQTGGKDIGPPPSKEDFHRAEMTMSNYFAALSTEGSKEFGGAAAQQARLCAEGNQEVCRRVEDRKKNLPMRATLEKMKPRCTRDKDGKACLFVGIGTFVLEVKTFCKITESYCKLPKALNAWFEKVCEFGPKELCYVTAVGDRFMNFRPDLPGVLNTACAQGYEKACRIVNAPTAANRGRRVTKQY